MTHYLLLFFIVYAKFQYNIYLILVLLFILVSIFKVCVSIMFNISITELHIAKKLPDYYLEAST